MLQRTVFDLNSRGVFGHPFRAFREGAAHASGQNGVRAVDGFHSGTGIRLLRESLSGRPQARQFFLLGPVSLDGLCATGLSGEPAPPRDLRARLRVSPLSSRPSRAGLARHRWPMPTRLAVLRRRICKFTPCCKPSGRPTELQARKEVQRR